MYAGKKKFYISQIVSFFYKLLFFSTIMLQCAMSIKLGLVTIFKNFNGQQFLLYVDFTNSNRQKTHRIRLVRQKHDSMSQKNCTSFHANRFTGKKI